MKNNSKHTLTIIQDYKAVESKVCLFFLCRVACQYGSIDLTFATHPGSSRSSSVWWSRSSARRREMASSCTREVPAGTFYTKRWAVLIFCLKNSAAMQGLWTTWIIWMRSWILTNTLLSSENAQKLIQFNQTSPLECPHFWNFMKNICLQVDFNFDYCTRINKGCAHYSKIFVSAGLWDFYLKNA